MKSLDEISPVLHMRFFWRSIESPKYDCFVKNSQKTINRSFFVDFNFINEFFSKFHIVDWKIIFGFFDTLPNHNWIFCSKMSIWVLKRTVLMRWTRFLILKIDWRSFSTLIRSILDKGYIYISLMYFFVYVVSSFSRKFAKLSKSWLISGCCNGKALITDQVIWLRTLCKLSEICSTKKNMLMIQVLSAIEVFPRKLFSILTVPLWWPPPGLLTIRFSLELILCRKTSAIIYKFGPITYGFWYPTGCVARQAGCAIQNNLQVYVDNY